MRYILPALASLLLAVAASLVGQWLVAGEAGSSQALGRPVGRPPEREGRGVGAGEPVRLAAAPRQQEERRGARSAQADAGSIRPITAPRAAATDAPTLARSVLAELERYDSIAAKIRYQVRAGGQRLAGTGSYQQSGRGEAQLWRLELRMEVADQLASLQQVRDEKFVWTHQHLFDTNSLTRIDLERVRLALEERGHRPGAAAPSAVWLSLGGLPKLVFAWLESFQFTDATPEELDGLAVWKLAGTWQGEPLAALVPALAGKLRGGRVPADFDPPSPIPTRVVLIIGRDDRFPYRLEYWRRRPGKSSPEAGEEPLAVMEWYEVQWNQPIDRRTFAYRPGDMEKYDQTSSFLKSLGLGEEKR